MNKFIVLVLVGICIFRSVLATPSLDAYGALPAVSQLRLSPSGSKYAFIATIGDQRKLYVVSSSGQVISAIPVQIADFDVRDVLWAGEDHVLMYITTPVKVNSDKNVLTVTTLLDLNLKLNQARPLLAGHAYSNFQKMYSRRMMFGLYGTAAVGGHQYAYVGTLQTGAPGSWPTLARVELDSGDIRDIVAAGKVAQTWVIDARGEVAAHAEQNRDTGEWRFYRGAGRDDSFLFERTSRFSDIELLGQGRLPGTIAVADYSGQDDLIEEVTLSDGKRARLFENISVKRFLFDPEHGELIGALTEDEPGASFFDPKLQARFNGTRKAFPGKHVELVSFSRNLDHMIVMTEGNDDSGTYWMVDIASGIADPIGRLYPEVRKSDVCPSEVIHYAAHDGMSIEGVLTLPCHGKADSLPLVVIPHGGPIGIKSRIGFDWLAQAYAAQGYAVLQPNYRGSGGYGHDFRIAGFGEFGGGILTDISDGVAELARLGRINPARVCIVGLSYGGYAALAGVTLQQGIYRCAVSIAGPTDIPALLDWELDRYGLRTPAGRYWRALLGSDKQSRASLDSISIVAHSDQAAAPILLVHGTTDSVVPMSQSLAMVSVLKRGSKPVEFVVLDKEDHWLSHEGTRRQALKAAVDFVRRYNPAD